MGIVSYAMLIVSGVYLTLGVIYLRFWWSERSRLSYLAFTSACFSYMPYAWLEMGMMRAATPETYLFFTWWAYLAGTAGLLSFAWFAYVHLHGRKWLFWTFCAVRVLGVIVHLTSANGIHFREVTAVGTRTVLGETLSYPVAVSNPWMLLNNISLFVLTSFFLDASIRGWRRGERRTALVFGTGTALFGTVTLIVPMGVLWGLVPIPLFASFTVLFMVAAMLYELNYDMHRAAMLSEKLEEREVRLAETLEQLQLSAVAGNVGMWIRSTDGEIIWASEKAGEIWGFPSGVGFTQNDLIEKLHPDDHERVMECVGTMASGKEDYRIEFRILGTDGGVRWVQSQGTIDTAEQIARGALVDVTQLKLAQEAVRELSNKLINAQEKERARLALELHDDLNQSLALLTIQLGMLHNEPKDLVNVKDQLGRLVTDLQSLTRDVHRISHELHPGKLAQLGLEAALTGFCRELSAAHGVEIDLVAHDLPQDLPPDVALCLYRVTQESLKNIIKHSGATLAHVSLRSEENEIRLAIRDDGNGFDPAYAKTNGGLGLISIDERVTHVGGTAQIISAVGEGTRIEVRIPVVAERSVLEAEVIV